MNFLKAKQEPATEIDFAAVADVRATNTEKQGEAELEGGLRQHHHHVDPALEARVVRKIDLTLVPLVMGLCIYRLLLLVKTIADSFQDLAAYIDRSNIGQVTATVSIA
jgi:hypothetical protein